MKNMKTTVRIVESPAEWLEIYRKELQVLAIKEKRCWLSIEYAQKEIKDIESRRQRAEQAIAKYESEIA